MHYFSGNGCSEFPKSMHFCIGILITSITSTKAMTTLIRKLPFTSVFLTSYSSPTCRNSMLLIKCKIVTVQPCPFIKCLNIQINQKNYFIRHFMNVGRLPYKSICEICSLRASSRVHISHILLHAELLPQITIFILTNLYFM